MLNNYSLRIQTPSCSSNERLGFIFSVFRRIHFGFFSSISPESHSVFSPSIPAEFNSAVACIFFMACVFLACIFLGLFPFGLYLFSVFFIFSYLRTYRKNQRVTLFLYQNHHFSLSKNLHISKICCTFAPDLRSSVH